MENELSKKLIETYHENKISQRVKYIKQVVAMYYGMSFKIFDSRSRKREIIHVRHIAIYLARTLIRKEEVSLQGIGVRFNGIDHATVIHANKKISGYLTYDSGLRNEIDEITKLVQTRELVEDQEDQIANGYYFIDLNNITSLKLDSKKAVVLVGFSDEEVSMFAEAQQIKRKARKHTNLGAYILEKKDQKN